MISAAEMAVQVAQTKAFIEADVEQIVFTRPAVRVRTETGGYRDIPGVVTPAQRVRMVHQPAGDRVKRADDTNGQRELPEHIVLGMPDADFQKGDVFDWRGQTWKIEAIHDKPDYIRKGDVILHRG